MLSTRRQGPMATKSAALRIGQPILWCVFCNLPLTLVNAVTPVANAPKPLCHLPCNLKGTSIVLRRFRSVRISDVSDVCLRFSVLFKPQLIPSTHGHCSGQHRSPGCCKPSSSLVATRRLPLRLRPLGQLGLKAPGALWAAVGARVQPQGAKVQWVVPAGSQRGKGGASLETLLGWRSWAGGRARTPPWPRRQQRESARRGLQDTPRPRSTLLQGHSCAAEQGTSGANSTAAEAPQALAVLPSPLASPGSPPPPSCLPAKPGPGSPGRVVGAVRAQRVPQLSRHLKLRPAPEGCVLLVRIARCCCLAATGGSSGLRCCCCRCLGLLCLRRRMGRCHCCPSCRPGLGHVAARCPCLLHP